MLECWNSRRNAQDIKIYSDASFIYSLLFNNIFESAIYPNGWCEAILCPLHKSGFVNENGNYRGIYLLPMLSKVFTKILNNRLVKWAENRNLQKEEQAGLYRKKCSTIDEIFSLQA